MKSESRTPCGWVGGKLPRYCKGRDCRTCDLNKANRRQPEEKQEANDVHRD